jgi:PAS domain S-box-containing protein
MMRMWILRRLHNLGISTQLALSFLVMGMLLIAVLTFISYTGSRKHLTAEVTRRIHLVAELKKKEIEGYLARHAASASGLARSPTILHTLGRMNEATRAGSGNDRPQADLTRILALHPDALPYRTVVLAPREGNAVRLHRDDAGHLESRVLADTGDAGLSRLLRDTRAAGGVHFHFQHRRDVGLQALVATPAYEQGRLVGLVVLEIPTTVLDSVMRDVAGLGESGETMLVALRGDSVAILAPTRLDPRAPTRDRIPLGSPIAVPEQDAARGIHRTQVATDYRGERVLAASEHLAALDWGLVAKIDAAEAFAPVRSLRTSVGILALASGVTLVLVGLALAKAVIAPIGALARSTELIRRTGTLPELPATAPREVRTLGSAFHSLVADLGQSEARLKDSVSILADRNAALAAEVERRTRTEAELKTLTESLEQRVLERTAEMEASHSTALESEERFRLLFEFAPDTYFLTDLDGRFVDGNRASEQLTGYRRDELRGKTFGNSGLLLPEELPKAARALALSTLGEPSPAHEYVLITKDGHRAVVEIRTIPLQFRDQCLVLGIARDVTDRKRAEQAMREREETIRAIVETSRDWIWAIDREGRHTYSNPAVENILGYRPEEIIGRSSAEFLHEDDRHTIEATLPGLIAERRGWRTLLLRWRHKDGGYRYLESSAVPILDATGTLSGFRGVDRDITDRVLAERAVGESEERYRTLFEGAPYGIYRTSVAGRFVAANPALVTMLGYASAEELTRIDVNTELYVDPELRARLIEKHRGPDRIVGDEVEWKRKDGKPITVRLTGRPLHDDDGNLTGFEMLAEDVTEQRALEAQLRQAQKMEAVGQLTGGIAHDFNNLLSVILLNTKLVESALEAGQPVLSSDLREIEAAAQKAAATTRKLLGFSRRADLKLGLTNLADVIRGFAAMLRRALPESIELEVATLGVAPAVLADAGAVEQILLNLATNARDAMPAGGSLTIELSERILDVAACSGRPWAHPGRYACIAVSDSGIGMDPETQAHIFEPFFTTKPVGVGTGLGLAMVYGLLKQHGGFIQVYSERGKGTTFRLYIPAAASDTVSADRDDRDRAKRGPQGGSETILVVEDEAMLRAVCKQALERFGYSVMVAADGTQALRTFRQHAEEIDLVLSDLVMPNMGGPELARALKHEFPNVKLLLVSGYSGREAAARRGVDPSIPFLEKPWALEDLLRTVRRTLDGDPASGAP